MILPRRLPVGRLAVLAAVVVGTFVLARPSASPRWRPLAAGLDFTLMRGDPYCRRGSPEIAILRLDPARASIAVHHYTQRPEKRPLSIVEWMRATGAVAAFNAGQYYPNYSYMGLLASKGRLISARPHPTFRAALVAEPVGGGPGAHVLDLAPDSLSDVARAWREVAQSFMLFDRSGDVRVRNSAHDAKRTLVAEDRQGRLLVLTTEGSYTLWEFARWLKDAPLGVTHAMSMDGGLEAELCVRADRFAYASFGHWNPKANPGAASEIGRVPLPAVVTVSAR
ncbi:MAG: phosphodiester glycosidase family protein [Candidatus Eisenbacteria bacterium]